ncbi:MAG: hypothetical protein AUJ49_13765 [Desulfovibrionaceae bacterium CG1_02_65_16]|nr:MAG: hypothetical protein AUJ49_13765 [Desulfovibrionaceae bacterium CG1_02_65_16]
METPRRTRRTARRVAFCLLAALLLAACAGHGTGQGAGQTGPAQARDATLRAGGSAIDYRDIPATDPRLGTRPLLLITGYAVTKEMWNADFVRALAAHRRVLLLDNRGMGPSTSGGESFGIRDMARDAAALLDALGIRQADVLGWSMGGMTAQELALARPDLVAALVLYATAPDTDQLMPVLDRMAAMSGQQLLAAIFPPTWAAAHPQALARLPKPPRPPDMNVIARQYAAMRAWTGSANRLQALPMPVLLLAGDADWVCPPEMSRRMADSIPRSRLALLPGGGHWMMHQFPGELAGLINNFLDATGGGLRR